MSLGDYQGTNFTLTNRDTGEATPLYGADIYSDSQNTVVGVDVQIGNGGSLPLGRYRFAIAINGVDAAVSDFCIVEEFPHSVLLQYTNYRTEFGTIFHLPFQFRIEGNFQPDEVKFSTDAENFRDQSYGPTQLSASPYEVWTLTVGQGHGVPNWVARKLNMIFSLSNIVIDGVPYVRSDGSSPEITVSLKDLPAYIYKIDLEPTNEVNYGPPPVEVIATCLWQDFVNIFEWVDANVVRTSVWRNAADMIDVLPSNRVRTGDWQNAADMIDDVPVNRMRTGNWSGLADMIDVWERNTECTWMDFVKILNYRVTTWQNAGDMIDVLPVNQSRTGDWQNAADMVDVVPGVEVRTGDWSGAADMVDAYPDPPRESYYVDTDGVRHDFARSNTPLLGFATSSSNIAINGSTISKYSIEEIHFGEDYDTEKTAGTYFLYNWNVLRRLTMPRNLTTINAGAGRYNSSMVYVDFGQIDASLSAISSATSSWGSISNVATCTRRHATQALADAWVAKFPQFSNWSVLIG